jgi:hypothetical protein
MREAIPGIAGDTERMACAQKKPPALFQRENAALFAGEGPMFVVGILANCQAF